MLLKTSLYFLLFLQCFCALQALMLKGAFRLPRQFTKFKPPNFGAKQKVANTLKRMPRYMMQLYQVTAESKRGMPYQANAIRGLNSVVTKRSNSSMKIFIQIENKNDDKNIMTVTRDELHLYMDPPDPLDSDIFKPFVLQFKDIYTNKPIRNFTVPAFNQGWQVLSLNKWTDKWVKDPTSNKGMLMTVYRKKGKKIKLAAKNPFLDFAKDSEPYLIMFVSESVRSLLAWRFLIASALNSVAGTQIKSHTHRLTRDLNQESLDIIAQSRDIVEHDLSYQSRDTSQQSQCTTDQLEVNLSNMKVNEHYIIMAPKEYHTTNCSNLCTTRKTLKGKDTGFERYCCIHTAKRHDMAVLLINPTTGSVSFEVLRHFVPMGCMWSKQ